MKILSVLAIFYFFVLNLSAQNVGINTPMPNANLHVTGNVKISDGTQGVGKVLTSDANGLASWHLPKTCFTVGSDQSISSNSFVGLGWSSSSFVRNTIVIPFNGSITSLVFSIRQFAISTVSCEIFTSQSGSNPVSTGLIATITFGNYFALVTGNVPLNQGDLISVKITSTGSITDGIAATIVFQ